LEKPTASLFYATTKKALHACFDGGFLLFLEGARAHFHRRGEPKGKSPRLCFSQFLTFFSVFFLRLRVREVDFQGPLPKKPPSVVGVPDDISGSRSLFSTVDSPCPPRTEPRLEGVVTISREKEISVPVRTWMNAISETMAAQSPRDDDYSLFLSENGHLSFDNPNYQVRIRVPTTTTF
jgi:hypothetical protein